MEADRRLYYAADGKTLVEENDERAAFLAYPKGAKVSATDARALQEREAAQAKPAPKAEVKPEAKAEAEKAPQPAPAARETASGPASDKAPAKGK
jgi:hypothetical protein